MQDLAEHSERHARYLHFRNLRTHLRWIWVPCVLLDFTRRPPSVLVTSETGEEADYISVLVHLPTSAGVVMETTGEVLPCQHGGNDEVDSSSGSNSLTVQEWGRPAREVVQAEGNDSEQNEQQRLALAVYVGSTLNAGRTLDSRLAAMASGLEDTAAGSLWFTRYILLLNPHAH
jgi:hypothetical protein